MKKLTKTDIEALANEIIAFLKEYELESGVSIYYNDREVFFDKGTPVVNPNTDPHEYFKWAAYNHILSMSFDGPFYDVMNGYTESSIRDKFTKILTNYGLYHELGDAWNLTVTPIEDMEIEYTIYRKPKERLRVWRSKDGVDPRIKTIMDVWYELSKQEGDKGSCVLGAGFKFELDGEEYFMSSCSPWQGSISWETHKDKIKMLLEAFGAKNIYYEYGNMD